MPNGAYLTAREWSKYGQFIIQNGKWDGKQIVKEKLLKECFKPSEANKGHGLTFWLNVQGGNGPRHLPMKSKSDDKGGFIYPDGLPDIIGALGAGKNRMYMIPSLKMVIVRQAEGDKLGYTDSEFLRLLLNGLVSE
jgi:CubicO group peptidase (beta-lactamase class C family)